MKQMNIFDFLQPEKPLEWNPKFKVGDKVHHRVLGEIRTVTVVGYRKCKVYKYYHTDRGDFSAEKLEKTLEQLQREAEAVKAKHKNIKPHDLEKRVTVEYTSMITGNKSIGQIGIYDGMLYNHFSGNFEYLTPYPNEKALMEAYEESLYKLKRLDQPESVRRQFPYRYVEEEQEMETLYWSDWGKCYGTAEFAATFR